MGPGKRNMEESRTLIFVRHGKTKGNSQGRYVGRTDEPLLEESMKELEKKFPPADLVIASPMLRCRQTAEILYPDTAMLVQQGLEEMDFGDFEYKNYKELSQDPEYQAYIDSGGQRAFPHGELLTDFKWRICRAFMAAMEEAGKREARSVALVVHGGTIMAILEAFGEPQKPYFDWQIPNGERITGKYEKGRIWVEE